MFSLVDGEAANLREQVHRAHGNERGSLLLQVEKSQHSITGKIYIYMNCHESFTCVAHTISWRVFPALLFLLKLYGPLFSLCMYLTVSVCLAPRRGFDHS